MPCDIGINKLCFFLNIAIVLQYNFLTGISFKFLHDVSVGNLKFLFRVTSNIRL